MNTPTFWGVVCTLAILAATLHAASPVEAAPALQGAPVASVAAGEWSNPATWGGTLPTISDTVSIAHVVTYDDAATVAGVTIATGGELRFDPGATATLTSTGNVVVNGQLTMRPTAAGNVHTLHFAGVDETAFVGGGMEVLPTDVGLWVMGDGKLETVGSTKTAWTRAAGDIASGATQITLEAAPVGWRVGDEISIVPTAHPSVGNTSWNGFDLRTIAAIDGATVTLSAPTAYAHPAVSNPFTTTTYTAEVLNLTRNVRIEGTGNGEVAPAGNGRAHIFIHSNQAQSVAYAAIRHMGPRQPDGTGYTESVLGRYGLHFHMSGDGSRGSLVEGVVVRDTGGHAFVPHASHGITLKDTISYNTFDDAYWWDDPPCLNCVDENINDTDDLLIDRAVAAIVRNDPPFRGYNLAGFSLAKGVDSSLTLRDSVAVGVQGTVDASGYEWPEKGHAVWIFANNIAHNNKVDGIFAWQNSPLEHVIEHFVAYHNREMGIDHGAYSNRYQYFDIDLFGNGYADFNSRASSNAIIRGDGYGHAIERARMTGKFVIAEHTLLGVVPTLVKDCIVGAIEVNEAARPERGIYDFVNCTKPDGSDILPSDFTYTAVIATSVFRVQHADGTAYQITGAGNVTTIAPFYALDVPTATPTATNTPAPTATYTPTPTNTPSPTPTATATLSPLADTIRDALNEYPDVRQELIQGGVIN